MAIGDDTLRAQTGLGTTDRDRRRRWRQTPGGGDAALAGL